MDEHGREIGDYCNKEKLDKSYRKTVNGTMQTGVGKSVFGRWLKDFRSSNQNKETKPHRPLGRTLSANIKDKDQKKKISRTLSANQRDRKKDTFRNGENAEPRDWDSGIFLTRNYRSLTGDEDLNGYLEKQPEFKYRERSFSNPGGERFSRKRGSPEINHSALVSYLDEEGLKQIEKNEAEKNEKKNAQESKDNRHHGTPNQDGSIMPTPSFQKKSTEVNHYENHESLFLNEKNKGKNSEIADANYPQINNYFAYKPEIKKTSFNYYNDSRYENLETTDYISWCHKDKEDKYDFELEKDNRIYDEKFKKSEEFPENVKCGFRFGYTDGDWSKGQNVPEAPARDPSNLKSIKYGPGHEKYPSWPGSVRAETSDKPHRSHSWTDQTNYPKEKVTSYVRPHSKRTNPAFTQQLKTVLERCEKITPESFQKTMEQMEEREKRLYLPRVDREGKSLGDQDYLVPSPPERDKPLLTQADLDKYYQENHITKIDNESYSTPYEDIRKAPPLTQADLEEYARSYEDVLKPHHQQQGSYAQSEGYHSYVSSSELTTTPFLDRLRRDTDSGIKNQHWSEDDVRAGRDSVVTTSSGSASSSETLKWHGSMSDVSVASSSCRSRQLIAHSSRVPLPQRHHSESVLYLGNQSGSSWQGKGDRSQQLKLFPVNTYTVQTSDQSKVISPTSGPKMSVAERINELERQQQTQKFAYYDPDKRHKVSDPTLKAIQKKALLSFYERHQQHASNGLAVGVPIRSKLESWKNDQQKQIHQDIHERNSAPPPPPPRPATNRRASCASDFSLNSWNKGNHSYSCSLVGPVIIGPSISIDDWVPKLPPKKSQLSAISPVNHRSPSPIQVPPNDSELEREHFFKSTTSCDRIPTPDLPPPPPPPVPPLPEEVVPFDEPLPPPPPEVEWHLATAVPRRSTPMSSRPTSPHSPSNFSPIKDSSEIHSPEIFEQSESMRSFLVPDAYEIQYDQDAINAIMESNRLAELQKKKYSKGKHGSNKDIVEEKTPLKLHIENRPPLPLPRDVKLLTDKKQEGCDRSGWQKQKENHVVDVKASFVRSFSKPENSTRASVRKSDVNPRSSLKFPSKKVAVNGKMKECYNPEVNDKSIFNKNKSVAEPMSKAFTVKKVSEYECRVPNRDRDGLTVFETTAIDDTNEAVSLQSHKGSNSKAGFLALRREKDLGMNNCEGSYKLTVSPSGETIDSSKSEMIKLKERSTENLVLDNRLTLEPPDLIPKISNLSRKSSSVKDVRDNRKKCDYNRFSNEKYRLITTTGNNNATNNRLGMFSENIIQNECKVTLGVSNDKKDKDIYENERIPVTTVECVRAVITKLEAEAPEKANTRKEINYQSNEESLDSNTAKDCEGNEKYGVSFTISRTETENKEEVSKSPCLLRVRSNVEKKLNRSDSIKSNEGKTAERSKSLKLVERSTSFGRSDTMRILGIVERSKGRNVNLSVSDASSQTDLLEEEPVRDEAIQKKMEEELECERLSRDLASQLSPSDKLQSLLVPESERKKPTDYVAGLFHLELSSKPRKSSPKKANHNDEKEVTTSSDEAAVNGVTSNQNDKIQVNPSTPSFLSTTEPRSKTSTKSSENREKDSRLLQKKKEELMARLDRKLTVLKEEQEALTNESTANEELGATVASFVAKTARPHELAKYRLHVEEVGKITSLLLGLSGRLAKVENALLGLPSHHDDRKIHESKRDKLQEQLTEAKQLKENIDKRSDSVAKTLGKCLNADEYADYVHFIRMKAKLIVDLREIADKISLGEEQLAALKETLSS